MDDDYDFKSSKAFQEGVFVGLALDEDNQPDYTEERLGKWLRILKNEFAIEDEEIVVDDRENMDDN